MIAVTGASGKLGEWVVRHLAKTIAPPEIVAIVRTPEKCADLARLGVELRAAGYTRPDGWAAALGGVKKLLLVSSNDIVGDRGAQHANVIHAARAARVEQLAYTSILKCDTSSLWLARDHLATEKTLKASGVPFTLLRNGWYLENHTEHLGPALATGAFHGGAEDGRFASASREDYALAAARVLTSPGHVGQTYELAGAPAYTMTELAAEVGRRAGKPVAYVDHAFEDYEKLLLSFHLPKSVAHMLADSDRGAAKGDLEGDAKDLQTLIGRAPKTLATAVAEAMG